MSCRTTIDSNNRQNPYLLGSKSDSNLQVNSNSTPRENYDVSFDVPNQHLRVRDADN